MPAKLEADAHAGLPPRFVQAWKAVDTIESLATFLFAAVSVQRPAGMTLAAVPAGGHGAARARPASTRWSAA